MNNVYIVPANSKKSLMILGMFYMSDIILFLIGATISVLLMLTIDMNSIGTMLLAIMPVLLSVMFVFPLPYYHNVLQLLLNAINFFMAAFAGGQRYYWKGWCIWDEQSEDDTSNKH